MKDLKDKIAVVTGAASGIGRALAADLHNRGCRLALADVAAAGLSQTAALVGGPSERVTTHAVDVSDRQAVYGFAREVLTSHGAVDIVINNAGVAAIDSVLDVSYDDFEWVMNVNFWGVVYGTKAFLPHLLERPEASVVNISSVNAFLPFPHSAPYCSSKYAVCGFTETLHQELEGTGVRVTSVHPGGIKTNIIKNSRFRKAPIEGVSHDDMANNFQRMARTTPESAARAIVEAIRRKKRRLLIGVDAYAMETLKRLAPEASVQLTVRVLDKLNRRRAQ